MKARRFRSLRGVRGERGFTLIEVLIVMTLTGILTGAITTGLFTALRSADQVQKVLPGPQAAQNLNSWLSADIESAIPSTIDTDPNSVVPIGCTPAPETGTVKNVAHFETTDPANSATLYSVSYRYHVTDKTLWRTFCVKGAAPSHHGVLVENLSTTAVPAATLSVDKRTLSLLVTVLVKDRVYPFTLKGSVRTPKDPVVTVPVNTSTIVPKAACAYTANNAATIGRVAGSGSQKPLLGTVTFTVTTNLTTGTGSTCEDLWVRVKCNVSGSCSASPTGAASQYLQLTQQVAPNTHVWSKSFTCPAATPANLNLFCSDTWKAGTYAIEVTDGYDPVDLQGSVINGPAFNLTVS